ncbi:MAG: enoyl-CoA hydratase/isomerase family protein, partial [Rubellimicrobium sp.]|nr:enoyl-CoA hydratase/isomerase family protein [Rubellimicrobium sp.]
MGDFTLNIDADGVATVIWDVPGRSMNVLSRDGIAELSGLMDRALADPAVRGIILTSAKDTFAGGMDLNVLQGLSGESDDPAQGIFDFTMNGHAMMRRFERAGMDPRTLKGGKPIVAALPGTALGIGLEIPLACHRIIAADVPSARIGLPEILVGIFPGGGGTTRLVRKLGLMGASQFLLEGKTLEPAKAASAGLIDEVVPAGELLERAKAWVLAAGDEDLVKPWDRKDYRFPGGAPYHPAGFPTFVGASAMVNARTMGAFPAAQAMLSAIYEGALVPFDTALKIEARWFTFVLMNPSSSAMIRSLFVNKSALEKGARRPDLPDQAVRVLGVIGAGMMGAGIALVAAQAGIRVVLIDADQAAADRGRAHAAAYLDKGIARRKTTKATKAEVLGRIEATTDHAALTDCDLVIEAVFEDPTVKAEVLARVAAAVGPDCIIATNTSTLPVTDLAGATGRDGDFIGIHFFSPVEKMALVEIIRGRATGDRAVARALDFVRQIRKTPIVVNDARFFYANRCIIPYINEGMRLVREGTTPALVDNAARLLGFPVGPLQLVDETSLDLGAKIAKATKAGMGDAYQDDDVDEVVFWMVEQGRLGRKANAGFFDYDEKGKRQGYWKGLGDRFSPRNEQPELEEVKNRLILPQVLEAVRALEEGVLEDIREGDVGAILGWGFAPWS